MKIINIDSKSASNIYSNIFTLIRKYIRVNNIYKKKLKVKNKNVQGLLFYFNCQSFTNANKSYESLLWIDNNNIYKANLRLYCSCSQFLFRCSQQVYNLDGLIPNNLISDFNLTTVKKLNDKYDTDQLCLICKHLIIQLYYVKKLTQQNNLFEKVRNYYGE